MNYDPAIWRVVVGGLGSLHEVKYQWTIDELMDAHELLDVRREAQEHRDMEAGASRR